MSPARLLKLNQAPEWGLFLLEKKTVVSVDPFKWKRHGAEWRLYRDRRVVGPARCEVARYVAGAAPRRTFGNGQLGQGAGCRARLVRDTTMPQSASTKSKAIFGTNVTHSFKSPKPT